MAITEKIKTFNTTVRTVLMAGVAGVICLASFYVYSEYTKQERAIRERDEQLNQLRLDLEDREAQIGALQEENDKLQISMQLLKTDQRLAQLQVQAIQRDEDGKALASTLEFVELSPEGDPLSAPKVFTLPGDLIYIDNWIVKFDDQYIQEADLQRGTSLCLFRRIFSEEQQPTEGVSLDEVGMRPQAYARGGKMSEFEESLWADFWEFANDPTKAEKMGIRAANGEATYIKVRENMTYDIELRASAGVSIQPQERQPDLDSSS